MDINVYWHQKWGHLLLCKEIDSGDILFVNTGRALERLLEIDFPGTITSLEMLTNFIEKLYSLEGYNTFIFGRFPKDQNRDDYLIPIVTYGQVVYSYPKRTVIETMVLDLD